MRAGHQGHARDSAYSGFLAWPVELTVPVVASCWRGGILGGRRVPSFAIGSPPKHGAASCTQTGPPPPSPPNSAFATRRTSRAFFAVRPVPRQRPSATRSTKNTSRAAVETWTRAAGAPSVARMTSARRCATAAALAVCVVSGAAQQRSDADNYLGAIYHCQRRGARRDFGLICIKGTRAISRPIRIGI